MPRHHHHHFGYEDAASTEEIISNGDWRQDFNGHQYYRDEDDGYESFQDWPRNKYRKGRRRTNEEDDLTPVDGWNVYDRGWDECRLREDQLRESWDGKMCQDTVALKKRFQSYPVAENPLPTTHVLAMSVYDHTSEQQQQQQQQQQPLLHWQKVETEQECVLELMDFIRALLVANNNNATTTTTTPSVQLSQRFETLDRTHQGVVFRHVFLSVLDQFNVLDLLSVLEIDVLLDRFASSDYVHIKYRAFVRALMNKKLRKRHNQEEEEEAEEAEGRTKKTRTSRSKVGVNTTLIEGCWRDEPFTARVVVCCNAAESNSSNRRVDSDNEATYAYVNFKH